MAPAIEKQTQKAKKVKGNPILVNASRVLRSMPSLSASCKSDFKFAVLTLDSSPSTSITLVTVTPWHYRMEQFRDFEMIKSKAGCQTLKHSRMWRVIHPEFFETI